jgi:fimbrial isopeptide formation D2 family protein
MIDLSFGFDCPENFDLSIQSIVNNGIVFPGQTHSLIILTGETSKWFGFDCFSDLSGTLNITAVGPIQFEGVPPTAITPSVNGFVYSYDISDFTTVTDNSFELLFLVDTTAQAGDNVTIYAEILSNNNEINISNNSMVFNYQVVNSYDPNLKEVYPQQVLSGYDDYFSYTIHFQNLGTAPAFNIRIADTLSNNLDLETFQVINYSDPNTITINNNILQVRFPNIMLPDSASNPEGSKGFIQYKIKPKSGLAVDSTIKNTAYIYFDYNPAVVTNTAITEYVETLDVATIEKESSFKIFPNPSNGQLNITTDLKLTGEIKIQLFDLSGKELEIDEIENTNSSNWKINLNENNGFYILKITNSEGNVFKKKIVLN